MGKRIDNLIGLTGLALCLVSFPFSKPNLSFSSTNASILFKETNKVPEDEKVPISNIGLLFGGLMTGYSVLRKLERKGVLYGSSEIGAGYSIPEHKVEHRNDDIY